jgi:hypothetical protein
MALNYQVIVERYPFPNAVVGGSIPVVKSSLYLTKKNKLGRYETNSLPTAR